MSLESIDLNLLVALDALLSKGSVTAAAAQMNLSVPAMSRTLSRIRLALHDPILVRAGRGLVMTPRAKTLRDRVHEVVEAARAIVLPEPALDLALLERTFSIRISDAFAVVFAHQLMQLVRKTAPLIRFHFVPEGAEDVDALREGRIDIDIGVIGAMGPEVRVQTLFQDHFVGVVRTGHPLTHGTVTPERYAEQRHISLSRRGLSRGPIDEQLEKLGLSRRVEVVVPSLHQALAIAEHSDLVAAVAERTIPAHYDVFAFPLPVDTAPITISQAWHPRYQSDPEHRWFREIIKMCPVTGGASR